MFNTDTSRHSISIPMPPPQSYSPTHASHHSQQNDFLSTSDNTSRRNSHPQLSSSAPSFHSSFLSNPRGSSSSNIDNSNRNSNASNRNSTILSSTMLAIEFDGGNQVIIRPNRIIRGKVLLNLSEKIHVTRIRVKVSLLLLCNTL
jgi:hypothetical protein